MSKIALELFREYFGRDTCRVVTSLCRKRSKTLRQVSLDTNISVSRCARILYTLICHGSVNYEIQGRSTGIHFYRVNTQRLLHCARSPLYLTQVRRRFGRVAERIVFCLVFRDDLTLGDVEKLLKQCNLSSEHDKFVYRALVDMYNAGLIDFTSAVAMQILDNPTVENPLSAKGIETERLKLKSATLRKDLYESECVKLASSASPHETRVKTTPLSSHEVPTGRRMKCTTSLTIEEEKMDEDLTCALKVSTSSSVHQILIPTSFKGSVTKPEEADTFQSQLVQTIVKRRFGENACRIFRLLHYKPQLEQKQISELAMIPLKDCREILGKLLKHEYVRMQEVARTTDHAPSRTYYLWKVHLSSVLVRIGRELQAASVNLRARLDHELRRENKRLPTSSGRGSPCKVEADKKRQELSSLVEKLSTCLLRIDELMHVFTP